MENTQAKSSSKKKQNKVFKFLDATLHTVEKFILSWSIIVISVMTVGNVLTRMITGSSWHFAAEISRLSVIVASFMGISYAARKGRHISMSALFDLSPKPVKKALSIINPLITALVLFIVSYYGAIYTYGIYETGRTTAALEFPFWLMVVAIPVGCFIGGIQFLRNMWMNIANKEVYLAEDKKDYDEQ
ncbi:TRAP transporter small permease [Salipaludibacillus aurantiacus]|uniref:TRAP-type C4-dicarboxylate transport system, small permease component n=1 Tax=Salipaludibacillus aurantiacus TaxID=1601833 RepID=A0A1H9WWM1_9BACI|nr:TRAP transporter small permease [Salipaludibacillus aurantiacus]SES38161.1 TRAP-type C4-dicarboxylate transport system, small permease component [Salipaludibacillus aurantiacus]